MLKELLVLIVIALIVQLIEEKSDDEDLVKKIFSHS